MSSSTCICCGCEIPEGRQVCYRCERYGTGNKNEKTYLDMLSELSRTVEKDSIPKDDKQKIVKLLSSLKKTLWKYSA